MQGLWGCMTMPNRQGIQKQVDPLRAGVRLWCRIALSCREMVHTSASRSPSRAGQHKRTSRLRLKDGDKFRNLRLSESLQRFDDTTC